MSQRSINASLLTALIDLAPAVLDPAPDFQRIDISGLALYNQDLDDRFPSEALQLKEAIAASDALLIACPEYNRTVPAVLTNALAWASRPYGENVLAGKPVAVVGASPGATGTAVAQQHLRNVLAHLDAPTLGQPEVFIQYTDQRFAPGGTIIDDSTRSFLGDWLVVFAEWIELVSSGVARRSTPA
jgi:chromate reductase